MKKGLPLMIACLMLIQMNANAKSGVYLTAADFKNRKLSCEKGCKIRLNNAVLTLPYITVVDHGTKRKLNKSDIFGYLDGNNQVYRFYNNEEYLITDTGRIVIYTTTEKIPQSKGYQIKKNYFFSTAAEREILPLTAANIKYAYRANSKFLDLVDQYFGQGDITAYDATHYTYKVNYVYSKSMMP